MIIENFTLKEFKEKFRVSDGKVHVKSFDGFGTTDFSYSELFCDLCSLEIKENFPNEKKIFVAETLVYCDSCFKKRYDPQKLGDLTIQIGKLKI